MKLPPSIKLGWKALQDALDALRTAIKERTPQQGAGISINESPTGFMISLQTSAPIPAPDDGNGLTADQRALLTALATDPGINGTLTTPPTDGTVATTEGPVEWLPYNTGKNTGWRKITYLSPITDPVTGFVVNTLYDVWSWTGQPFNPRPCSGNTFGGS